MALYPLCQHGEEPRRAVQHASDVIERTLVGDIERADSLALLSIFSGLAYPRLDINGIIGKTKMKESRFAREMREEGASRSQFRLVRDLTLDVLRVKFGTIATKDLPEMMNTIEDVTFLLTLHHLAASCSTLDEFKAGLPALQATP